MDSRLFAPGYPRRYLASDHRRFMLTHCSNSECYAQFATDITACPLCGHPPGETVVHSPIQLDEPPEGLLENASLVLAVCFFGWAVTLSGLSVYTPVFAGLVATPYLFLWSACRTLTKVSERVTIGIALVGCCLLSAHTFLIANRDILGGLALVFTPLFQLGGLFASLIFAAIFDQLTGSIETRSGTES